MIIIKKPVITEKITDISEKLNRFAFIVDKNANNYQIKDAIEKLYDVKVESVNTMNYDGKKKSRYTKSGAITGKKAAFKKAIVTLKEGNTIDFYSNI